MRRQTRGLLYSVLVIALGALMGMVLALKLMK
jgi:hypothetical protein